MFCDPGGPPVEKASAFGSEIGIPGGVGHPGGGLERSEVDAGEPGVRSPEFHVEGVMLPAGDHAGPSGIPAVEVVRTPGVFNHLADRRPHPAQPAGVSGDLPLPVDLHNLAKLTVHAGAEVGLRLPNAERQFESEMGAARSIDGVAGVRLPERTLQIREEEGRRLRIVPDVGAAALAAAGGAADALPPVEGAVLQPQHGRGAQYRQI